MQEKEAKLSCETQAQHAQQGLQQASALEAGKPDDTAAKKANPQELQQAEVSA